MRIRKIILLCGLLILLSGCKGNTVTPQPSAEPTPTPYPSPTATAENTSQVEGLLNDITPTSVSVVVNGALQDYPAISKVNKDATDLTIKKKDKVIVNLKNGIAQSIEKIVSE